MGIKINLMLFPALVFTLTACREGTRPNIVIVLADDMGYGDLRCQNPQSKIPTPNLDRLASQGMRFTDAHSASSVSSPSRYSILTGRYHWRGHLTSGIISQWGDPAIEKGRVTIASMLKEAGYSTACIGKWHLGEIWPFKARLGQNDTTKHEWTSISMNGKNDWGPGDFDWNLPVKEGPVARGFDYYFGTGVINFPPYTWIENDKVLEIPDEMLDLKDTKPEEGSWECRPGPAAKNWDIRKVPIHLLEKTVEWINNRRNDPAPFFLYYALPSPHAPIIPGKQFLGKSEAGGFGDYVTETDWIVGQVLDALKRNGFEKNTMVIFTSDNGPEVYAYERIKNFSHFSMGEMRGLKRDLWEGGHRVPFIVKYPGKIPAGRVCDKLFSQTDIMATIAAFTGCNIPENAGEDSFNMKDVFHGESAGKIERDFIIYHSIIGSFAIRKGNWILIEGKTAEVSKEPEWFKQMLGVKPDTTPMVLYNLATDPGEKRNLYVDYPEKVNELKELLEKIRENGKSLPLLK
jgi:arylsulfatase A